MDQFALTEREKSVLRYIIHQFILTASPVGSRLISKHYDLGVSPATIRNIMADLEDTGLLGHPHTSAGRVPTDVGYRYYVDSLMDPPKLEENIKNFVETTIENSEGDTDEIIPITARILSDVTNQLACVTYPKFVNSLLEKIQLVQLSTTRILIVISIKSGMVRTITLEINVEVKQENLQKIERILNERLSGLRFSEIKQTFAERLKDYNRDTLKPIIRVFIDSVDKIFADESIKNKSVISGTSKVIKQPEFEDIGKFQGIIELIEDKDVIVHLMENQAFGVGEDVSITIGSESKEEKFNNYSMITKEYKIGNASGTVGIIGPKRMDYSKILAAVAYVAESLAKELKNK